MICRTELESCADHFGTLEKPSPRLPVVDLHDITGFDVDFDVDILENLLSLYRIGHMGRYIGFLDTFKPRSCPTSVDEGTTIVIIGGMMNVVFKSCPLDTLGNRL